MKLAFVISSLALGGAQRALTTLAAGLARRGHHVHVLSFDHKDARPFFPLDPAVRLHALDLNRPASTPLHGLASNLRRLALLRRTLREIGPDAVLGFMDATAILCILAGLGTGIPVLACERTDPARHDIGPLWSLLRRVAYPLAARVLAQTRQAAASLPGRVEVLPNAVAEAGLEGQEGRKGEERKERGREEGEGKGEQYFSGGDDPPRAPASGGGAARPEALLLLALGRLAPEKGFDVLLEALGKVAQARPDWQLVILGEGEERERLAAQVRELGLQGRASLPGAVPDPGPWLRRAALFVLPSRYEGFPNALAEALAWGVPAVACNCPGGVAELLRPEVDGLLVPPGDVGALAEGLARLMDDAALRTAMAARAPEVLERFGLEKVLDLWEALLDRVLAERAGRGQERG